MLDSSDKALMEKTFASIVRKSLGEKPLQVIKKRLVEKYGISLHQAVSEEYGKLSDILKENFTEGGATNIQNQFHAAIIDLHKKPTTSKPKDTIIEEREVVRKITECVGDKDMMLIMNHVRRTPRLISEILESCKVPRTSVYRKINKLVDSGLLIISGYDLGSDGRRMFRYTTSFDGIAVFIEGGKSKIRIKSKKIGKNSYLSVPF